MFCQTHFAPRRNFIASSIFQANILVQFHLVDTTKGPQKSAVFWKWNHKFWRVCSANASSCCVDKVRKNWCSLYSSWSYKRLVCSSDVPMMWRSLLHWPNLWDQQLLNWFFQAGRNIHPASVNPQNFHSNETTKNTLNFAVPQGWYTPRSSFHLGTICKWMRL